MCETGRSSIYKKVCVDYYQKTSIMNKHDDTIITKMKTPLQAISRKNVRNG